jgi:hypothetical protein
MPNDAAAEKAGSANTVTVRSFVATMIQFANSRGIERSAGCGGRSLLAIDSLLVRPEARLPLLPD